MDFHSHVHFHFHHQLGPSCSTKGDSHI
uniref:Uncharacterized protein n=1 Tax=Arundo donax TaxID=35708 RepID=A0A0A9FR14_ARUDO